MVICGGVLVSSDSVRTAAPVVIIYLFATVPHVLLYSSTINNVRSTVYSSRTPDEWVRVLSSLFLWFSFVFSYFSIHSLYRNSLLYKPENSQKNADLPPSNLKHVVLSTPRE